MEFLTRLLDDPTAAPCGQCANDVGRPMPREIDRDLVGGDRLPAPRPPADRPRKRWAGRRVDGLSGRSTRRTSPASPVRPRRRGLGPGGPARHGRSTALGSELVAAAARAIRDRWQPDPAPSGSRRCRPTAARSSRFAARSRGARPAVRRRVLRSRPGSQPQRAMQNSVLQLANVQEKLELGGSRSGRAGPARGRHRRLALDDDGRRRCFARTPAVRCSHSPSLRRAGATERHVPLRYTWPTSPTPPTGGSAHGRGSRSRARPGAVRGDRGG